MRFSLLLWICWLGLAQAEPAVPPAEPQGEDKAAAQARARSLREQAAAARTAADAEFAADNKACLEKFLVSNCIDDAKLAKQEKLDAARRIEQEGRAIERDLRKRDFAEHERKRAEAAPQRAADAAAQAQKNRQAQEEAMQRVERKRQEAAQREPR